MQQIKRRIIDWKDLQTETFDNKNKKIVLAGGCFDVLHYGHLIYLTRAAEIGDFLVVALESDIFIKKNKKRIPIHTQKERAAILAGLRAVDAVVLLPYFSKDTNYLDLVKKIRPQVIAVTKGDSLIDKKRSQAKEVGARVSVVTKKVKDLASSKIIGK